MPTSIRLRRQAGVLWLAVLVVCGGLAVATEASSVVPMSVATLADHAGQVIVGEVVSTRSYWAESPRRIETEVVFAQVDYLKGRLADSGATFALKVPGGTVGDMTLRIADAPTLAIGEKWVLFLLPQYKVHPVVGLAQGAFRVTTEGGVARVRDAAGRLVTGVDARGYVQTAAPAGLRATSGLVEASGGVRAVAQEPEAAPAEGLTYEQFVAQLRPVLAQSRDHGLTGPAGRPALAALRAVPLKAADGQAASGAPVGRGEVSQTIRPGRAVRPVEAPSAEPAKGTAPAREAQPEGRGQ